jgi:C4-dicarboxylate-specific signal transduction histidine kinase
MPLYDEQGRLVQWFGTNTDVEERRLAEEALRAAHAELAVVGRRSTMGELAASLAHELNQPLATVVANGSACLRWLRRDPPDLGEAMATLDRIIRDAHRASDVLAHTRAHLTTSATAKAPLDLAEVVHEVLLLTRAELSRHRIETRAAVAESLPRVLGARVELQQVILNLVVNAIDAMAGVSDRRRELVIRADPRDRDDPPGVLVAVEDAGIGLAALDRHRLFDAFYTTKSHGLGMGLSISRSIVQAHGGRLWATQNPGQGATFHFVLPAWDGASP